MKQPSCDSTAPANLQTENRALRELSPGHEDTIVEVSGTSQAAKRLADFGFVRGALVEMIRTGNPCLVRIEGTCVALGSEYQGYILVSGGSRGCKVDDRKERTAFE